eukprot:GHVQ01037612.1.p1 GENE.GHVQ01037612.1~~GHVQ01037612.1.p1  ORF type:complete len:744 (+),score=108.00 GHVQ01037612.1:54-2234(+)
MTNPVARLSLTPPSDKIFHSHKLILGLRILSCVLVAFSQLAYSDNKKHSPSYSHNHTSPSVFSDTPHSTPDESCFSFTNPPPFPPSPPACSQGSGQGEEGRGGRTTQGGSTGRKVSESSHYERRDNWAVIVSTSQFYYNYRHVANALSFYKTVKRLGIPDRQILLFNSEDIACNARNGIPGTVYNDKSRTDNLYGEDLQVDYRGYDVSVKTLLRLLTGRHSPHTSASKRLLSSEQSNVFVFLTGHGGAEFLQFQHWEDVTSTDLADALEQMYRQKRYKRLLFIAESCQASTLQNQFYSPNILALGSSKLGESSFSHHADNEIGITVIDRFTYFGLKYLDDLTVWDNKSVQHFFDSFKGKDVVSTPEMRQDLFDKSPEDTYLTEFLASNGEVSVSQGKFYMTHNSHPSSSCRALHHDNKRKTKDRGPHSLSACSEEDPLRARKNWSTVCRERDCRRASSDLEEDGSSLDDGQSYYRRIYSLDRVNNGLKKENGSSHDSGCTEAQKGGKDRNGRYHSSPGTCGGLYVNSHDAHTLSNYQFYTFILYARDFFTLRALPVFRSFISRFILAVVLSIRASSSLCPPRSSHHPWTMPVTETTEDPTTGAIQSALQFVANTASLGLNIIPYIVRIVRGVVVEYAQVEYRLEEWRARIEAEQNTGEARHVSVLRQAGELEGESEAGRRAIELILCEMGEACGVYECELLGDIEAVIYVCLGVVVAVAAVALGIV